MARRPVPIKVKSKDLAQIGQLLRGGIQQVRVVLRALALRLLAEGVTAPQVAQTVPLTPIPDLAKLKQETKTWNGTANRKRTKINWQFTRKKARKLFKYEKPDSSG